MRLPTDKCIPQGKRAVACVAVLWLLHHTDCNTLSLEDIIMSISITGRSCHKYNLLRQRFCHDTFLVTNTRVCRDKSMLAVTKVCWPWQNFVFLWKLCLSREKFCLTNILLSQQNVFCHGKHVFVMTKHLSQQKRYLWQLLPMIDFCRVDAVLPGAYQGWRQSPHNYAAHSSIYVSPCCSTWCQCVVTQPKSRQICGMIKIKHTEYDPWRQDQTESCIPFIPPPPPPPPPHPPNTILTLRMILFLSCWGEGRAVPSLTIGSTSRWAIQTKRHNRLNWRI